MNVKKVGVRTVPYKLTFYELLERSIICEH